MWTGVSRIEPKSMAKEKQCKINPSVKVLMIFFFQSFNPDLRVFYSCQSTIFKVQMNLTRDL